MIGGYGRAIAGALAFIAIIGAFFYGRSTGIDHQRAADAKVFAKGVAAMDASRLAIGAQNGMITELRNQQADETGRITRDATIIVRRPIYSTVCVDADGGGLLTRAAANANREPAGEPAGDTAPPAGDAAQN